MTCFIRDKGHYFNLDHIATIREVRPNLFQALDESGAFMDEFSDFFNVIVKLLPAGPERWECLIPDPDKAGVYMTRPVVAWGLNPEGLLLPFLPHTREAMHCEQDFALRQTGEETVYTSYGETYENAQAWLESMES